MVLRVTSRWEAEAACDRDVTHLISIQNPDAKLSGLRPESVAQENHLVLLFTDVMDADDPDGPKREHVRLLIDWVSALDRTALRGLVVHCDAGVSRSTAAAWLALIVLEPQTDPGDHLRRVAKEAGAGYCWPSDLVTAHGDRILDRGGSLVDTLQSWKTAMRNQTWGEP